MRSAVQFSTVPLISLRYAVAFCRQSNLYIRNCGFSTEVYFFIRTHTDNKLYIVIVTFVQWLRPYCVRTVAGDKCIVYTFREIYISQQTAESGQYRTEYVYSDVAIISK